MSKNIKLRQWEIERNIFYEKLRGVLNKTKYIEPSKDDKSKNANAYKRIFGIWYNMKRRCYMPSNVGFKDYGGRGITICDDWLNDYNSFYKWAIENGYENNLTIDRIDNDGNYSPENCRWITRQMQNNNKRNIVRITFNGETKTLTEWSEIIGVPKHRISLLLKHGYSFDELFFRGDSKNG